MPNSREIVVCDFSMFCSDAGLWEFSRRYKHNAPASVFDLPPTGTHSLAHRACKTQLLKSRARAGAHNDDFSRSELTPALQH